MRRTGSTGKIGLLFLLLTATLAVTLAVAFLVVPEPFWNGKFGLSLGALVLAECLVFFFSAAALRREGNAALPLHFVQVGLCWAYLCAVGALAYLAVIGLSIRTLLAWHLVALLGLALGLGVTLMAGSRVQASHVALVERQAPFQKFRDQFSVIVDRIELLPSAELAPLKQSFGRMRDDLRYMDGETLPGAEAEEDELRAWLSSFAELSSRLETEARAANPEQVAGIVAKLTIHLQQLRLALRRRSERLRALR